MRTYKRKTDRGKASVELLDKVYDAVKTGLSIREAAKSHELCHVTLSRFIKKRKATNNSKSETHRPIAGYYGNWQVFNPLEEEILTAYIQRCSDFYFGLTTRDVRHLAYLCAQEFKIKMPPSWSDNEFAGVDWLSSFLKRHTSLSLRSPEATSLARATRFNETNVSRFFDKLGEVLDRFHFRAVDMWNTDETGVTTVQNPSKIIARKGVKQVGAMTSAERGELVTLTVAVSASGNTIPPMFVFPRIRYKEHFVRDGPVGCIGTGNSSGWSTAVEFLIFLKNFVTCVRCTKEKPVLLLLNNHQSYIAPSVLDFAKNNGVVMLSFPPHCTHRFQPLDRSIFGPLKKHINSAMDAWIRNNRRTEENATQVGGNVRHMTVYDIPSIVKIAFPLATTPNNIQNGFKKCGIFPFNKDIFDAAEFSPSFVTDRPYTSLNENENSHEGGAALVDLECSKMLPASQINDSVEHSETALDQMRGVPGSSGSKGICSFSPESVMSFPKAKPRKMKGGRKRRSTAILTDTPVKKSLQEEYDQRQNKKAISKDKKFTTNLEKVKRKIAIEESSDEDSAECFCLVCLESYSTSKPGEEWVKCLECQQWSHVRCAKNPSVYVCHNCESDNFSE